MLPPACIPIYRYLIVYNPPKFHAGRLLRIIRPLCTAPPPRADRHRRQPPPVWRRAAAQRPPPCRCWRGGVAIAAVPPFSGVRGRCGESVLPYPRRAALGDGGAKLSPVDPLPLLQPAPDHPLQLPHTAAQRFQLSFVPLLGFLRGWLQK